MKNYAAIIDGETVEVAFEWNATGIEATIGGRSYSLEISTLKPGVLWINWNHQSREVCVTPTGESYAVSIGGHRIPVEILDGRRKLRRTARSESGVSEVRAPMPGRIVRILTVEGGDVEIHQGIVVMEAMKMQNEIKSPKSGKIRNLAVGEGDTVRSGDLIAIVDAGV